jgi:hypothetical protein
MVYIPDDDSIIEEVGLSHFLGNKIPSNFINSNNLNMFTKIYNWIVYSSVNPEAISVTLKGLVPLLVLVGVDSTHVQALSDNASQLVVQIGIALSGIVTAFGLARKIYNSFVS